MAETYLSDSNAVRYGREALVAYQNVLVDWYPKEYHGTFDTLLLQVQTIDSDWMKKVGEAAYRAKFGQRRLYESVERVVDKNGMKVVGPVEFNQGFVQELSSFDFSLFGDAAIDLAESVAAPIKAVAGGAVDAVGGIGDSLSFLGKNLKYIIALVVGILLFVAIWD